MMPPFEASSATAFSFSAMASKLPQLSVALSIWLSAASSVVKPPEELVADSYGIFSVCLWPCHTFPGCSMASGCGTHAR